MTHQEALDKALTVKWGIGYCSQGEQCWCRSIVPVEDITWEEIYNEDNEETKEVVIHPMYIVATGEMYKEVAERIVTDHNKVLFYELVTKKQ